MGIFENKRFSDTERAWYMAQLQWAGEAGGLTTNGARKAAKATRQGKSWTLSTGKELQEAGYKPASKHPKDAVWLIIVGQDGIAEYQCIADDFTKFKRALNRASSGDYNGGVKYDAWVAKNRKGWSITVLAITAVATVAVCIVAPEAAPLVAGAGMAISKSISAGGGAKGAVDAAVDSGALEAAAESAGVDPALIDTAMDIAASVDAAINGETEAPSVAEEPEQVPSWTDGIRVKLETGYAFVAAHPLETTAAIGAAIALRRVL